MVPKAARLEDTMTVAEMIDKGIWKWPIGWIQSYTNLASVRTPILNDDIPYKGNYAVSRGVKGIEAGEAKERSFKARMAFDSPLEGPNRTALPGPRDSPIGSGSATQGEISFYHGIRRFNLSWHPLLKMEQPEAKTDYKLHPVLATQLIVASDDDSSPSLRTVIELPAGTNWNFDVHWYPKIPGVMSASSLDEKIDEDDNHMKELRSQWCEQAYNVVANALLEMNKHNASARYVGSVLWNFREGRKAHVKEVIVSLINQLKAANQWANIERVLGNIRQSESVINGVIWYSRSLKTLQSQSLEVEVNREKWYKLKKHF
ncbi:hypothetical protein CTI12_AA528010 [Artemisia annua]|uniref:Factor of DNA methylation 1-5/IDN2 domain-containing protein n=1 Tax=Artemisia annua TaxID=35608 RepID=A0A2U1L5J2_ARTAN|nr:hypothetical protein CTI12_AA528010 [Artemisia annua]